MLCLIRCPKLQNYRKIFGSVTVVHHATIHGLFDVEVVSEIIQVGKTMEATKTGSLRCSVEQVFRMTFFLQDIKLVPDLWVNIFASTTLSRMIFRLRMMRLSSVCLNGNLHCHSTEF